MNIAVILAGGIGTRVGSMRPKQFIEVLGKPVIAYTIEAFQNHDEIDAIEVVCHKDWKQEMVEIREKYELSKVKWIIDGGKDFQESVKNGVDNMKGKVNANDILVIHFAASPFVTHDIISDSIRVSKEKGNAISTVDYFLLCGRKDKRTSVEDPNNFTTEYIDRDTVACMSSPHSFQFQNIYDMYQRAVETGVINTVEPHTTTLMYKMGETIFFSKGSQINIKITQKEDLDLFEGYVLMRQKRMLEEKDKRMALSH